MALTLTAETGRTPGSRSSSRVRTEGQVPAVVYGLGREAVSVTVAWPELRRVLITDAGVNALITLDVDGQTDLTIIKDLQRHPVRRNVMHVDFLRVDPDALVAVDVPVVLLGFAKDVEDRRGVVDQAFKTITVKAKPADIPSHLETDISELTIGSTITVSDIALPEGVTTDMDPDSAVVVGVATRFSETLDHGGSIEDAEAAEAAEAAGDSGESADSGEAEGEADEAETEE